jgi:hypothetical protein
MLNTSSIDRPNHFFSVQQKYTDLFVKGRRLGNFGLIRNITVHSISLIIIFFSLIVNQLYIHKTLGVNYTSYNLRRQKDVINPADVMVLSRDDGEVVHPFWYARVIKIFHLLVCPPC